MGKIRDAISVLSGFRKFSIMLLLVLVAITFRIANLLSGAELVDLLRYTTIAFFSANGIEHTTKAIKEWVTAKAKKELKS